MNKLKKKIFLLSLISLCLLVIAVFPIPEYNFFILLRWIITFAAVYITYVSYKSKKMYWSWVMGIVALVFNPIRTFHFEKETWAVIDIVVAVLFGVTILIFMIDKKDELGKDESLKEGIK